MAHKQLIEVTIWKDKWFRKLPEKSKLLFLHFMTNESINPAGMYEIDDIYLKAYFNIENLEEELAKLYPKIKFDLEHDLIWITNYAEKNSKGEKMKKSIRNTLEKFKRSNLVGQFIARYPEIEQELDFEIEYLRNEIEYPENEIEYSPREILINDNEHDNEHDNDNVKGNENARQKKISLDWVQKIYNKKFAETKKLKYSKMVSGEQARKFVELIAGKFSTQDHWNQIFENIENSKKLLGLDENYKYSFVPSWLFDEDKLTKIYNGEYSDDKSAAEANEKNIDQKLEEKRKAILAEYGV